MSIQGGIDNKNSVALMQDDTTCTEMITEAQAEADLDFTRRKLQAIFSPGCEISFLFYQSITNFNMKNLTK